MDWIVWKISFIYYSSQHMGLEGSLETKSESPNLKQHHSQKQYTILNTNLSQKPFSRVLSQDQTISKAATFSRPTYL